ncbi:MAG: SUMF1/EgtB/PvdO family nonheme iron enzyme [Polyangiales bacterium]
MGKSRSKTRRFSLFPKKGDGDKNARDNNEKVEKVTHKTEGDEHTIEVVRERLETSAMAVFTEPKAETTPLAPPVSGDQVLDEQGALSQTPVTLPESTSRPQILARWSVQRLERWAGSRWRLVATVLAVALLGLIVKERSSLAKFFNTHLRPASAAKLDPIVISEPLPCPPEMAFVKQGDIRVCVDKWEGSIAEILPDGTEQPFSPYLSVEGHKVKAVSKPGVVPNGYISHDEAQVACQNAGKRLCDPQEWLVACEGPSKTTYTYGTDLDEGACNVHGRSPLGELFSASFKDHLYDSRIMNDPSLNALEGTVAKTGSYDRCTNGFGVFDMVGNLHEWTAEKSGAFRGGYYLDTHKNGEGCRYVTTAHNASYHDYSTGFRCCKPPQQ